MRVIECNPFINDDTTDKDICIPNDQDFRYAGIHIGTEYREIPYKVIALENRGRVEYEFQTHCFKGAPIKTRGTSYLETEKEHFQYVTAKWSLILQDKTTWSMNAGDLVPDEVLKLMQQGFKDIIVLILT